ncbi:MAG: SH3 domain-containing protein [Spirochaetales bacterium]
MKSRTLQIALLLVGGVLLGAFAVDVGDKLFVQVQTTPLRTSPSFLAPTEITLEYGTPLRFRGSRGDWYQVARTGDDETVGWIFSDAVERDGSAEVVLQGERVERRNVTSREVALAGRGFSENLEQEYGEGQELDFEQVDAIEARVIDGERISLFIEEARLRRDFLEEVE